MRLQSLELLAYGPFTDVRLDLSAPGLQLIYGPNEAGKSTSLRAITGLLYGIAAKTPDAHLHGYKALRIGGTIASGGEQWRVIRRKGSKNTLLDEREQPVDETRLVRALGGVSRELFVTMFGLDHRSLRDAAQALLRGEGDLGESLFDAGGARGIGETLRALRQEAEALYKPRGQNQLLNEALRAYGEARKAITYSETAPRAYLEQKRAVDEAMAERERLVRARREVVADQKRLSRTLQVLPLLAQHRDLTERLAALADVPKLAADAPDRRRAAQEMLAAAAREIAHLTEDVAALTAEREALALDDALADLDAGIEKQLDTMLARHRGAAADVPRLRAKLAAHRHEAEQLLSRLGRDTTLDQADALRLDAATHKRIETLAKERSGLVAAADAVAQQLRKQRARRQHLSARIAELPEPVDGGRLAAAVKRAARAGDVDAAVERARARRQTLADRVARRLAALGRVAVSSAQLDTLGVPSREEIQAYADRWRAQAEAERQLRERTASLEAELEQARKAADELARAAVPSEAALRDARQARDAALAKLRAAIEAQRAPKWNVYEERVRAADELADRLRWEAERVARRARLEAEQASLSRQRQDASVDATALSLARERLEGEWAAAWRGVTAGTPLEMLGWLDKYEALLADAEALEEARAEEVAAVGERERLRAAIVRELPGHDDEMRLATLLDVGEPLVEARLAASRRRADLLEQLAELDADIDALALEHEARQARLESWRQAWAAAMSKLGLPADAQVSEAEALLEGSRQLFEKLRDVHEQERRLEGIGRDAGELEALARPLIARLTPARLDAPLGEAVSALLASAAEARQARQAALRLDAQLADKRADLADASRRRQTAAEVLDELARAAGVADAAELEAIEARAAERSDLERRIEDAEKALFEQGGTIAELAALCAGIDRPSAEERLEELERERERLDTALSAINEQIGRDAGGLGLYQARPGAHEAAMERQACLATVRRLAERYAKIKLASVILEREIERYREENQGPIVRRASQLFPRVTLGAYRQLKVDFDGSDEPELRCIGADGSDVPVSGLSDGARDQLYLALRLASLERYAEHAELLPFIADDILIHFDDDRARAAIEVLDGFSDTTQVLMFTHHARVVELAREAVAPDRLTVHALAGGHRRAKAV